MPDYEEWRDDSDTHRVASVWRRVSQGARFIVLPSGYADVFFRRTAGEWSGFFVGPSEAAMLPPPTHDPLVGVRLRLGAARTFVGLSLHTLRSEMLPLDALGLGGALDPKLLDAAFAGGRGLRQLAAAIDVRAMRRSPVDPRVCEATDLVFRGVLRVSAIAARVGVTERHLARLFESEVGLSPKGFVSVVRFGRAMATRHASKGTWASVAAHAGYADEAHLARDARRRTGLPLSTLGSAMSDSFNEGHLGGPTFVATGVKRE